MPFERSYTVPEGSTTGVAPLATLAEIYQYSWSSQKRSQRVSSHRKSRELFDETLETLRSLGKSYRSSLARTVDAINPLGGVCERIENTESSERSSQERRKYR